MPMLEDIRAVAPRPWRNMRKGFVLGDLWNRAGLSPRDRAHRHDLGR